MAWGSDGSAAGGRYSDQSEWQRSVSDAAAPSGNEATAAGGGNKEPSEWQRSIKSRESASPKILSGTATGTESTGHLNRNLRNYPGDCHGRHSRPRNDNEDLTAR